jgi:hypothetical protein
MNSTRLYRIAAIVFLLFAAGHTIGFLTLKPPTAEATAVVDGMNQVHFQVRGADYTYGGFYRGFGLSISVNMLLSAILAWTLGDLSRRSPEAIGTLAWSLAGAQVAGLVLALAYFSLAPALLSAVAAILLGVAAWKRPMAQASVAVSVSA